MDAAEEPVRYMERTRDYYRALGYTNDYVWARHDDVPFARLAKPLALARIGLITTASPPGFKGGIKELWFGAVSPPPAGLTTAVAWDRESTHTNDRGSY